jgi:hypothetical protein
MLGTSSCEAISLLRREVVANCRATCDLEAPLEALTASRSGVELLNRTAILFAVVLLEFTSDVLSSS